MAVPSYTSDLVTITDAESGTFTEPTGAILGTLSAADTDNFIQGTRCTSKSTGASGAPARAGIGFLAGAAQTITSPSAVYVWVFTGAGALIDTYANGGIRVLVGNTSANYKEWYVLGNDTFPYVGWTCVAVDPSLTADFTQGSPTATLQYFGADFNCLINIGKGNPMAIDKIAHGRTVTVINGQAGSYGVFSGIAAQNDTNTNRWGQFQAIPGGYQLQGRLLLGTSATAVDFRDSNVSIVTAVSLKVAASFNAVEVQNASSRVDWSSVTWTALGTVSRGTFTVTDNATVNLLGCSFVGLSTFTLLSNTTVDACTFRLTDRITPNGCTFTNNLIAANRSTIAVTTTAATLSTIQNNTFQSGGTGHALEITGSAGTYSLIGNVFTGYAGSNGSTGNEAVYVNIASGSVTLNIAGGGNTPSIRTAGATVTVVAGATVTFTGLPTGCDIVILTAGTGTILDQVDQHGSTSYSYAYQGTPTVDVGFLKPGYVPYYIRNLALGSVDSSIPVSLTPDRNYV